MGGRPDRLGTDLATPILPRSTELSMRPAQFFGLVGDFDGELEDDEDEPDTGDSTRTFAWMMFGCDIIGDLSNMFFLLFKTGVLIFSFSRLDACPKCFNVGNSGTCSMRSFINLTLIDGARSIPPPPRPRLVFSSWTPLFESASAIRASSALAPRPDLAEFLNPISAKSKLTSGFAVFEPVDLPPPSQLAHEMQNKQLSPSHGKLVL